MEDFTPERLAELCLLLSMKKDNIHILQRLKDLIKQAEWSCDKMLKNEVDKDPQAHGPEDDWVSAEEGDRQYTRFVCGCWRTIQEESYHPGYSICWKECLKHKSLLHQTSWPVLSSCDLPASRCVSLH